MKKAITNLGGDPVWQITKMHRHKENTTSRETSGGRPGRKMEATRGELRLRKKGGMKRRRGKEERRGLGEKELVTGVSTLFRNRE